MADYHIESINYRLRRYRVSPEDQRLLERIQNPQDLEDGLLAVQMDEAIEMMRRRLALHVEAEMIRCILRL